MDYSRFGDLKSSPYRSLFKHYIRLAKRKNFYFDLSIEEFEKLVSSNCDYCGKIPSQKYHNILYNGIDRKDNSRGYENFNCVPCCWSCNSTKGGKYTYAQMKAIAEVLRTPQK